MFVLNLLTYRTLNLLVCTIINNYMEESEFTVHNHQIMLLNATTLKASNYMIPCPYFEMQEQEL